MLAGALVYLVPGLRSQLDSLVRGQIKGAAYLMPLVDSDMTFLPAVLMCHGMALHVPKLAVFSPQRIESLLSKAADYPEQGAALRQLCGTLASASGTALAERWGARISTTKRQAPARR